jgi:hypothetical protein
MTFGNLDGALDCFFLNFHPTIFLLTFHSIIFLSIIKRVSVFIECGDVVRVYRQGTGSLHFHITFCTAMKRGLCVLQLAQRMFHCSDVAQVHRVLTGRIRSPCWNCELLRRRSRPRSIVRCHTESLSGQATRITMRGRGTAFSRCVMSSIASVRGRPQVNAYELCEP